GPCAVPGHEPRREAHGTPLGTASAPHGRAGRRAGRPRRGGGAGDGEAADGALWHSRRARRRRARRGRGRPHRSRPRASSKGLPDALAEQLAIRADSGTRTAALVRFLASKQMLLVLDNFEHLLRAAPLVEEIRSGCPGVKVLTTSREPLRVAGEHGYRVEPLD